MPFLSHIRMAKFFSPLAEALSQLSTRHSRLSLDDNASKRAAEQVELVFDLSLYTVLLAYPTLFNDGILVSLSPKVSVRHSVILSESVDLSRFSTFSPIHVNRLKFCKLLDCCKFISGRTLSAHHC